jgi:type IV pilus assembly protein PilC
MPEYIYSAKTKDAKTIKDTEAASSREELVSKLRARGLFIISIREVKDRSKKFSLVSLFGPKRGKRSSIKLYDLTLFARNLSTTLSSGITLLRSLEILSAQTESAGLERILKESGNDVREGLSLSEAVAKYPKVFSSLWRGIIEVGEASGNLPFVLERLADYLERRMEFERKIKSALIYPSILVVVAMLALFIFFKFILPKFTTIFDQFNVELPLPTKVIFGISKFLDNNFLLIIGGIVSLISLLFFLKNNPHLRKFWDRISLRLPLVGKLIFLSSLERFTSTFYILLDSGLPLVYTLEIVAKGVGNCFLEKNILSIKERVREGASLSEEFSKANIFPLLVSEMAKIGEETGSMPQVFKKISLHYQKELTIKVERFVAAFEPLMIVFMGLIIGSMVISLFLPIFKIATLGGGM